MSEATYIIQQCCGEESFFTRLEML